MKIATFSDHLFHQKYLVTFGTIEEIVRYLRNKYRLETVYSSEWGAFSGKLPNGLRHLHFEYYGFSAIVHETNHSALDVINDAGIVVNQHTKEIFAYYQEWLAGKICDYLEKWKEKEDV